ncbi:MAG: substrate-binding domain-containing protein [Clostridiales bacterium]|nr:substrate-binding domain-containing protein [Clostridiales bacterium]
MKKLICLALALMLAIAAFDAFAESEKPFIGVLAPSETHGWVAGVAFFAQNAIEEYDVDYRFRTSSNAEEMSAQIEELIGLGVDAIVVWPQFKGVETAAEMALEKGILISNFDMIINVDEKYADKMYLLTGDNYGMGYEGARYIDEKLEGVGKVLVLCKPAAGNVNEDRCRGFYDYLEEYAPDIEVIAEISTDFVRATAHSDMTDALTRYGEIDAVFSLDDETSIGALQAIREAGRTDIKVITGGGGCQEYFKMMTEEDYQGIWVASATYSPDMIVNCIDNIIAVLQGDEIEHEVILPTNIVDRNNVEDFLNSDSPY